MKRSIAVFLLSAAFASAALAADVTNKDPQAALLVIVEGDSRIEVAIDAGATESLCPSGCFITTPSGDRIGLAGNETVEIVNGSAVVK